MKMTAMSAWASITAKALLIFVLCLLPFLSVGPDGHFTSSPEAIWMPGLLLLALACVFAKGPFWVACLAPLTLVFYILALLWLFPRILPKHWALLILLAIALAFSLARVSRKLRFGKTADKP